LSPLDIQRHGRVVELALDRPQSANAFNTELYDALAGALEEAAEDPEVSCVLLAAAGKRFCAGVDLDELGAAADSGKPSGERAYDRLMLAVEPFPKPLLAAVNGVAVGIGFTVLGHADVILASTTARFLAPFASLGLVPEAGSTATLPARLGPQRTARLLFSGDALSAEEAERCGFVDRVVEPAHLRSEALSLAERIAAMPLESLTATKRLLLEARGDDAAAARRREDRAFRAALARPDTAQRIRRALARPGGG
jgi:enoyl-CoA hydratase/carnithine racemase